MIQNNLDYAVAQHPHELITYGGRPFFFKLGCITDHAIFVRNDQEQTLTMYSGSSMGLFPS
jgi:urocanate hydratase